MLRTPFIAIVLFSLLPLPEAWSGAISEDERQSLLEASYAAERARDAAAEAGVIATEARNNAQMARNLPAARRKEKMWGGGKYVGELQGGDPDGYGITHLSNGTVMEGKWSGKAGKFFYFDGVADVPNGERVEAELKSDDMVTLTLSPLAFHYRNGSRYEGEIATTLEFEFMRHGSGVVYNTNGDRYEGEWQIDSYDGYGVLYRANGEISFGLFRSGRWNSGGRYLSGEAPPEVTHALMFPRQPYIPPSEPYVPPPTEPTDYSPHPPTPMDSMSIDKAKSECEELGFEPKTEKFGECVLSLTN